jgi:hypothetical protein
VSGTVTRVLVGSNVPGLVAAGADWISTPLTDAPARNRVPVMVPGV